MPSHFGAGDNRSYTVSKPSLTIAKPAAGWVAELSDGTEVAVPHDLDTDIDRWGVTAIVQWAREAGHTDRDGPTVRAIVSPQGERITQF